MDEFRVGCKLNVSFSWQDRLIRLIALGLERNENPPAISSTTYHWISTLSYLYRDFCDGYCPPTRCSIGGGNIQHQERRIIINEQNGSYWFDDVIEARANAIVTVVTMIEASRSTSHSPFHLELKSPRGLLAADIADTSVRMDDVTVSHRRIVSRIVLDACN